MLLVLVHIVPRANGQTAADVKRLRTKLFVTDGYNKMIRPTDNQTQPIGNDYLCEIYTISNSINVSETYLIRKDAPETYSS